MAGKAGRRGRGRFARLAAVLALFVQAAPLPAGTLRLDPENLYRLSLLMLDSGRPEQALAFSEALVRRDPGDARALAVKSWAERDLGRYGDAVQSARLAWASAETAPERFGAAMAVAQGLASGGHKFRAQWWLRRAMQAAPDDAARRVAERDFAYVRARSRLSLRLDLRVQPSSNVNNGSSADVLWFYGLPLVLSGDAQALSGVEGHFGLSARYRLQEDAGSRTDLVFGAMQSAVRLSDEAQVQAPDAEGGDYARARLDLGLEHRWRPAGSWELMASAGVARDWYGGAPLSRTKRLAFGAEKRLTPRLALRSSLALEWQDRLDSAISSARMQTLGFGATMVAAGSGARTDLALTLRDSASASDEVEGTLARLRLDWTPRQPVLGAEFSLGLWAERRDLPHSRFTAAGRADDTLGAELSLAFEKVDYMGFVPVVTLGTARTSSNVDLYDSRTTGISVSVRSKF